MPDVASQARLPGGPRPWPVVGHIPELQRDPLGFFESTHRRFPKLATLYLFDRPIVLFFRPEDVHAILVQEADRFSSREAVRDSLDLLGDGLLTIDGEAHREQRRLVQPAFRHKEILSYADVMLDYTEQMLATWRPGQALDTAKAMQELTLRIVAKALFDVDLHAEAPELGRAFSEFIENPEQPLSLGAIHLDLPFLPYGKRKHAQQVLDDFVYALIERRRTSAASDIVSALVHPHGPVSLSSTQVRDHAITFLAAGHETTSNALAWTFYLLSQHPETESRLREELGRVLAGRAPTPEDLPDLPYLDAVVLESMRQIPPVWRQARYAQKPFELEGYAFEAGTFVMISQWICHHLEDVWGDPQHFRPERWLGEGAKPPQGAYFPFGAGPRMCIGMPFANQELRLILARTLQRFHLEAPPGMKPHFFPSITLRPRGGLPMTVRAV